jgi:UDP-N-acetylmuramoylalanine--D-glutamate ligase
MSAIKDKYKDLLDSHHIAWEEGHHTEELILNADEVIKSPGIPNDAPLILKLKAKAHRLSPKSSLPDAIPMQK